MTVAGEAYASRVDELVGRSRTTGERTVFDRWIGSPSASRPTKTRTSQSPSARFRIVATREE